MTNIADRNGSNVVYVRLVQQDEYQFEDMDEACVYMACSADGDAIAAFEDIEDAFEDLLEHGYAPEHVH